MKILLAGVVGLVSVGLLRGAQEPQAVDVAATYRAAHAEGNRDGLAALWREYPDRILGTFDADLEAGLAAWEKGEEGHEAKTAEHFARALWGAEIASEVTERRIFADYAGAFASWTDEQRKSFRAGQKAFGAARGAQKKEDWAQALEHGKDCRTRAMALGDWWGAAMGYYAEGAALRQLGRLDEASAALALARLINRDLWLVGAEFSALSELADCLDSMDSGHRAIAAVKGAIELGQVIGADDRVKELEGVLLTLQR